MKPTTREVTSVGVRDDKVANKGKRIVTVGALLVLGGLMVYKSSQKWVTNDEFRDLMNNTESECDEPTE